jgi:hypothetical protein
MPHGLLRYATPGVLLSVALCLLCRVLVCLCAVCAVDMHVCIGLQHRLWCCLELTAACLVLSSSGLPTRRVPALLGLIADMVDVVAHSRSTYCSTGLVGLFVCGCPVLL